MRDYCELATVACPDGGETSPDCTICNSSGFNGTVSWSTGPNADNTDSYWELSEVGGFACRNSLEPTYLASVLSDDLKTLLDVLSCFLYSVWRIVMVATSYSAEEKPGVTMHARPLTCVQLSPTSTTTARE